MTSIPSISNSVIKKQAVNFQADQTAQSTNNNSAQTAGSSGGNAKKIVIGGGLLAVAALGIVFRKNIGKFLGIIEKEAATVAENIKSKKVGNKKAKAAKKPKKQPKVKRQNATKAQSVKDDAKTAQSSVKKLRVKPKSKPVVENTRPRTRNRKAQAPLVELPKVDLRGERLDTSAQKPVRDSLMKKGFKFCGKAGGKIAKNLGEFYNNRLADIQQSFGIMADRAFPGLDSYRHLGKITLAEGEIETEAQITKRLNAKAALKKAARVKAKPAKAKAAKAEAAKAEADPVTSATANAARAKILSASAAQTGTGAKTSESKVSTFFKKGIKKLSFEMPSFKDTGIYRGGAAGLNFLRGLLPEGASAADKATQAEAKVNPLRNAIARALKSKPVKAEAVETAQAAKAEDVQIAEALKPETKKGIEVKLSDGNGGYIKRIFDDKNQGKISRFDAVRSRASQIYNDIVRKRKTIREFSQNSAAIRADYKIEGLPTQLKSNIEKLDMTASSTDNQAAKLARLEAERQSRQLAYDQIGYHPEESAITAEAPKSEGFSIGQFTNNFLKSVAEKTGIEKGLQVPSLERITSALPKSINISDNIAALRSRIASVLPKEIPGRKLFSRLIKSRNKTSAIEKAATPVEKIIGQTSTTRVAYADGPMGISQNSVKADVAGVKIKGLVKQEGQIYTKPQVVHEPSPALDEIKVEAKAKKIDIGSESISPSAVKKQADKSSKTTSSENHGNPKVPRHELPLEEILKDIKAVLARDEGIDVMTNLACYPIIYINTST